MKIAESDFREKEQESKISGKVDEKLSEDQEARIMEDYFKFEGNSNFCAKIWFVLPVGDGSHSGATGSAGRW